MHDSRLGSLIGRGRCAEVFAWEDGHVLKLFYGSMSGMAARELKATQIAYQSGLPVPAVEGLLEVDGRWGIVMERVDGPSMEDHMKSRPWSLFDCARVLAELHAKMHSCEATGLRSMREVVEGAIGRDSGWPLPVREATLECVDQLPEGNGICHWDFHSGNIIMTERGPIIIDWSEAVLANVFADAAMTWLLLRVSAIPPWVRMRQLLQMFRGGYYSLYLRYYRRLLPFRDEELTPWKVPVLAVHITRGIPEDRPRMLVLLERLLKQLGYL
jgi:tRNA A-37 threonylcarbamoyl transferase component Bud32